MDSLNIRQFIGKQLVRGGHLLLGKKSPFVHSQIRFRNPFSGMLIRRMGVKMEPRVIQMVHGWNDVTVVGKNHMLDVTFGNATPVTQIDPWYIGLINNSPSPVLSENDTLASHAGWSELTGYTGNRKAWVDADAAAKVKGTTTVATFVMNATQTVNGIFIAGADTGTASILWATGSFDEVVDVINTDELKISYGIRT